MSNTITVYVPEGDMDAPDSASEAVYRAYQGRGRTLNGEDGWKITIERIQEAPQWWRHTDEDGWAVADIQNWTVPSFTASSCVVWATSQTCDAKRSALLEAIKAAGKPDE